MISPLLEFFGAATLLGIFTTYMGVWLYWAPVLTASVHGLFLLRNSYENEIRNRDRDSFYKPSLTVGTVVGYGASCLIPVVNIFLAIAAAYSLLSWLNRTFGQFLDIPLVPRRPTAQDGSAYTTGTRGTKVLE